MSIIKETKDYVIYEERYYWQIRATIKCKNCGKTSYLPPDENFYKCEKCLKFYKLKNKPKEEGIK